MRIRWIALLRGHVDLSIAATGGFHHAHNIIKALLAYGARFPKELMLFVKNMVFLDGAIARLAPDLDLFAEITHIATYFATTHGENLAAQVGMDPAEYEFDPNGVRAAFGVDDTVETMTYRDLQARRQVIRDRLRARHASPA